MGHESRLWGSCLAALWTAWDGGVWAISALKAPTSYSALGEGVGRETRRAWAQGHQQHQVSFHLYKDSLTPEHINTLMTERHRDSRPAPRPRLPSPPPPLRAHLPPLLCLLSLLSVPPLLSPPFFLLCLSPRVFLSSSLSLLLRLFFFLSLSVLTAAVRTPPYTLQLQAPARLSGSSVAPDSLRHQLPQGWAFVMVVPEQRRRNLCPKGSQGAGLPPPRDMLGGVKGKFGCGTLLKRREFWGGFSVLYFL